LATAAKTITIMHCYLGLIVVKHEEIFANKQTTAATTVTFQYIARQR